MKLVIEAVPFYRKAALAGAVVLGASSASAWAAGPASSPVQPRSGVAESKLPWWEAATQPGPDGVLDLRTRSWWPRAAALKTGGTLLLDLNGDGRDDAKVRIERLQPYGQPPADALVLIVNDDDDGFSAGGTDDVDSDCYVVDYGRDGLVDRLVDYLDNDRDGLANEMEIRYFREGKLKWAWFWEDHDRDGHMWRLANYEYDYHRPFDIDSYGDNMLYLNKYDPKKNAWMPFSECPFAFYDLDGDGQSECVVRVSAVPIGFNEALDPDFANNYGNMWDPVTPAMARMGNVNVRYSYDIDGGSTKQTPLHYDFGFNLVGKIPYEYRGMRKANPLRRAPQETVCIRWDRGRAMADTYRAEQTGFSWHEYADGSIAIGHPSAPEEDRRWEGVFWTWNRRIMQNTGGPVQHWNIRREFRPTPVNRRELYWSGIDQRIHLKGAREGWLPVGAIGGRDPLYEVRYLDSDNDGYFDRWELWLPGQTTPVRVTAVRDPQARDLKFDFKKLQEFYFAKLSETIAARERMLEVLATGHPWNPPASVTDGLRSAKTPGDRRFLLDVSAELHAVALRETWAAEIRRWEGADGARHPASPTDKANIARTVRAWSLTRALQDFEMAFGVSDAEGCARAIKNFRSALESKK